MPHIYLKAKSPSGLMIEVNAQIARAARQKEALSDLFVGPKDGGYHATLTFQAAEKQTA